MTWVSAPVGGGVRVGTRFGGGRGGGDGGSAFGAFIVICVLLAAAEWMLGHWWATAIFVLAVVGLIRLAFAIRAERIRQETQWQVGHRTEKDHYVVTIWRVGEEMTIRRIRLDSEGFSDRLSEARAEACVKIEALEAHERREAEMQR